MKYIDEFRDGDAGARHRRRDRRARPTRPPLQPHGVLRRPHPRHLALRHGRPAAAAGAHDPRPRLPGVRAADRAHRHRDRTWRSSSGVILCTYGDTLRVPASGRPVAAEGQGARRRHPHGLFAAPTRCSIAQAQPGARGRVLRHRLRDHHAAHGAGDPAGARAAGCANFSVFCNHVLTPAAITSILESPEVRELGTRAARRLRRPGACVHRDRQPALRILRRGVPQAGGDRRLRAARRDAGDPDAGAPGQRRPRRGRERIHARRDARRQPARRRRWWPRCSSCGAASNGAASASALQRAAHPPKLRALSTPKRRYRHRRTARCPTTRPANAARSCAA